MKNLFFFAAFAGAGLPAAAAPVTVRVFGPDDQPLPSARVSLGEKPWGEAAIEEIAMDKAVEADGTFKFDWDGEFGENRSRFLLVRVSAPAMATQTRYLSSDATKIALQPGRSWGGLVTDAGQVPLAGVAVVISKWEIDAAGEKKLGFNSRFTNWAPRAVTDAQGRWQIDGVPMGARVDVRLDDARFVRQPIELRVKAGDAPAIVADIGATIIGQIVDPDGAPVADAPVIYYHKGGGGLDEFARANAPRTDAQGRFVLSGVKPGTVALYSRTTPYPLVWPETLIPRRENIEATAGKTTDIGQWKSEKGRTLQFRAIDALTKQPIDDADFNSWGNEVYAIKQEASQFTLRLLTENTDENYAALGTVKSPDHVATRVTLSDAQKQLKTLDLGDLQLKRGTALTGTVEVEAGDFAVGELPNLMLSKGREHREFLQVRADKREFTTEALEAGAYKLKAEDNLWTVKSEEWQLVSPQTITVPETDGETPPPIVVTLRRLKAAPPDLREVRGQLRDAQGVGVAGAIVNLELRGSDFVRRTVTTDAQGNFFADGAAKTNEVEISSIERGGYFLRGEAEISIADGVATVSGVSLKKRGSVFAGRVRNEAGQPVAGAWVAALGAPDVQSVQTGADGAFEIADLPIDEFDLIAAKDAGFARIKTRLNADNVELKLQAPAPADREKLAAEVLQGTASWGRLRDYRSILGMERATQIMERQEKYSDYDMEMFALELVARDPAEFARRAPAWLPRLGQGTRARIEAELWWARAKSGGVDDKIEANNWLDEDKGEKRAINAESVTKLLQLAAVADALRRDDAAGLLDYAAAIAAQVGQSSMEQNFHWSVPLAHLGYDGVAHFTEGTKPKSEFEITLSSTYLMSFYRDFAGANRAIERAEFLAQTPAMQENLPEQEFRRPAAQIDDLRQQLAIFQAPIDPAGALAQVDLIKTNWIRLPVLIRIADAAIALGELPLAERALRAAQVDATSSNRGGEATWPLMASLGGQISPELGAELWAIASDKLRADARGLPANSVAWWAFYHAARDAGQSRVLLEREWSETLSGAIAARNKEENSWEGERLKDVTTAMATIAPARAMEMRAQMRQSVLLPGELGNADVQLGAALLATPQQRARFGVDKLN